MFRYFLRRLVLLIPVIIAVSFIIFALMDVIPGDAMSQIDTTHMTSQEVADLRVSLGIDDPVIVRYGRYMSRVIQGDLGRSELSNISVFSTFMSRLPNTLYLAFASFVVGVAIAVPLGVFTARRAGTVVDNLTTAATMVGMSMPGFWLGILLMLLFSYRLGWLPAGGFRNGAISVVLPALAASGTLVASTTRQTRSAMLEVLKADFLRTARAKGVPESVVIQKHALGNALIPIVTSIGLALSGAIAGSAVIETVFAWPGIGRFMVDSLVARDTTAVTGIVMMTTMLYVLVQLSVDMVYALVDPRVKAQYISAGKTKKRSAKPATALRPAAAQSTQSAVQPAQRLYAENLSAEKETDTADADRRVAEQAAVQSAAMKANDSVAYTAVDDTRGSELRIDQTEESVGKEDDRPAGDVNASAVDGVLLTKKYRKRSQIGDVIHHLKRNPGAIAGFILLSVMILCFIASFFIPFELVTRSSVANRLSPPSATFPFGTDGMGRNLFIRVIYAARFSLPIGFSATTGAALIGVTLGSFAAYYGKTVDDIIMRLSDTLHSIPGLLLGMVIVTALGRSLTNLIIAVGVSTIPIFIRIARASSISIKGNEFIEAARAIGLSNTRIIFTQVLPNSLSPIVVTYSIVMGMTILASAGLSFLGFGIPVPNPEWGALVSAGRSDIQNAPWLTALPGLFIMATVMAFNMIGDGLRDALDPKMKKR